MSGAVVGAVRVERVWESKLRENYVALTGEVAPTEKEEVIKNLELFISKNVPEAKRVQCDVCLGWSNEDADACPYCNDEGPPAVAESGTRLVAAPAEEKKDPTAIDATALEASGVELQEPPKKKTKTGATKTEKKAAVSKPPPAPKPSAPVVDIAPAKPTHTEKELEKALEDYRAASTKNAGSFWKMGAAISRIHNDLWQQRTMVVEGKAKPKYKSWNQFVEAELGGISVPYANRLRSVASTFTEAQAEAHGPAILITIARAPKEEHNRLLEQAKNLTPAELENEVKNIREQQGISVLDSESETPAEKGKKQTRAATEKAAAKRRENAAKKEVAAATLGLKHESGIVKMLAYDPKGEPRGAKSLEDKPHGQIECINGVMLKLAIVIDKDTGELAIRYSALREQEE
jgi:hypothetical protein